MTASASTNPGLTVKDFKTTQQVKWCPGCGDHSALVQLQKILVTLGVRRENICVVSGIGCSSRFPYYMNTFGFHSIHGRAPAIATGVKCANPDLDVWIITGDGDALSIGGNHILHTLRRNVGLKIVLLNNRIYGLTKGQYSPTSELGARTKSSPAGSIDYPIHPLSVALGAEATFVARSIDADTQHMQYILRRAAKHEGTAFVEVLQNCAVYNANAYAHLTDRATKDDHIVYVEHAKPMIFGKNKDKGLRLQRGRLEVVNLAEVTSEDLIVLDEEDPDPTMAFRLAHMQHPEFPVPVGVFREHERPTYETMLMEQIAAAREKSGAGKLDKLFRAGDTWEVTEQPDPTAEAEPDGEK